MKLLDAIFNRLQRKTASTNFIPQIDGLRFLAIWLVVADHIHRLVCKRIPSADLAHNNILSIVISRIVDDNGAKGVFLFFMISGFILGMPFARHFWFGEKPVSLHAYFYRRVTRLEPPYILSILTCYILLVFVKGNEFANTFPKSFSGIFPNFLSSLVYLHNILMPNTFSVSPVSWSLEIEIQFYVLVPLLVLILKMPAFWRRTILTLCIAGSLTIQAFLPIPFVTIYGYIQYFLLGFLLLDLYLSGFVIQLPLLQSILGGALILGSLFYVKTVNSSFFEAYLVVVFFCLGMLVLTNSFWSKVFSLRALTCIGGMCYTIYLWHSLVLAAIGNKLFGIVSFHSYSFAIIVSFLILLPCVLAVSTVLYLLVERPCMDKNWPGKVWGNLRRCAYWINQKI